MHTPHGSPRQARRYALTAMSEAHIRNVVVYLALRDGVHGPMTRPGCSGFTNPEWLRPCAAELTLRQRMTCNG